MRQVLLIEPNYKNKYPPMGLMKIATYYKMRGDCVTFFKGELRQLDCLPLYDVICVTSLFTFYWKRTIETIKRAQRHLATGGKFFVGGIAATLLPERMETETGIRPLCGLLDKSGELDEGDETIIDALPPDYSILDMTDYKYPCADAYILYMTRGCIRRCPFCAVSTLEPEYKEFVGIKKQIDYINSHFGQKKNLLLMDNNVLASQKFDRIVDEIKACGFGKGARGRHVDFNQGLDARLLTDEKMARLAELNISPLRIAFDHYEQKDIYIRAVRCAVRHGVRNLSNYVLYNFTDAPVDLYHRLRINIELNEELNAKIYSFPMKFHPLQDIDRKHIGEHWNRKFIRAIQCILIPTHGTVGTSPDFFRHAFGATEGAFIDLLWAPELFIRHREKYKACFDEWRRKFNALPKEDAEVAKAIIADNVFTDDVLSRGSAAVRDVLRYYSRIFQKFNR